MDLKGSIPNGLKSIDALRASSIPSFRFVIDCGNETLGVFTECTLPTIEWELEEVKEGGRNDFVHQLPGRRKSARLTLKNGVGNSELMNWFWGMLEGNIDRRTITVKLLNAHEKLSAPVLELTMHRAYPVKWSGPQLKSDDNSIAIQSIEFACGEITRDSSGSAY